MQIIAPVVGDYLQRHCTGADGLLGELIVATREGVGTAAGCSLPRTRVPS